MAQTNGLDERIEGGALCSACRALRPFGELLAFVRVDEFGHEEPRVAYVCRPSLASDLRLPLCTSRVLGSAEVHAIALATDVERLRRRARRPQHGRREMPAHVRQYAGAPA